MPNLVDRDVFPEQAGMTAGMVPDCVEKESDDHRTAAEDLSRGPVLPVRREERGGEGDQGHAEEQQGVQHQ